MRGHIDAGRKVLVNTQDLIRQMKENRQEHITAYDAAVILYAKALAEALVALSAKAIEAAGDLGNYSFRKLTTQLRDLEEPQCYADAYAEAIALFEWEESEQVELTIDEFRKYVLNEWSWSGDFARTVALYSE